MRSLPNILPSVKISKLWKYFLFFLLSLFFLEKKEEKIDKSCSIRTVPICWACLVFLDGPVSYSKIYISLPTGLGHRYNVLTAQPCHNKLSCLIDTGDSPFLAWGHYLDVWYNRPPIFLAVNSTVGQTQPGKANQQFRTTAKLSPESPICISRLTHPKSRRRFRTSQRSQGGRSPWSPPASLFPGLLP